MVDNTRQLEKQSHAYRPAVPVLDYASPVQQAQRLPPFDPGPFIALGRNFIVPGNCGFEGRVIVSPLAIYLLKRREASSFRLNEFSRSDIRTCAVAELCDPVRSQLDRQARNPKRDVVVLPRDAISRITMSPIGKTRVRIAGDTFLILTGFIGQIGKRRRLGEMGWVLNENLAPTAAPVHGSGYGRTAADLEIQRRYARIEEIILYISLGTVAFVVLLGYLRHKHLI